MSSKTSKQFFAGYEQTELTTTVDQWREALSISRHDDPGQTAAELAFNHGIPRSTIVGRLEQLVKDGWCKTGMATRKDSRNRPYRVKVYQLEEKKA